MSGEGINREKTWQQPAPSSLGRVICGILVAGGIAAHLGIAIVAGNHLSAPWSGVGDTREYVTLTRNLLAGDGFTYAHQPTAFRAPLYPMFLAVLMRLFPNHWAIAVHALQFFASLLLAWLCAQLASRWFGAVARRAALIFALWLPTFAYFTGEILTECTAALLTILYLLYLNEAVRRSRTPDLVLLGVFAGLAALERFNSAALAEVAFAVAFAWLLAALSEARSSESRSSVFCPERWRRLLLVAVACAIVVSPWLLHTAMAFHGRALYSTHGGFAAVEGVLMPLGRTQPGETPAIESALGWGKWEVESNDPRRLALGAEPDLNNHAWDVAFGLWRDARQYFIRSRRRSSLPSG